MKLPTTSDCLENDIRNITIAILNNQQDNVPRKEFIDMVLGVWEYVENCDHNKLRNSITESITEDMMKLLSEESLNIVEKKDASIRDIIEEIKKQMI